MITLAVHTCDNLRYRVAVQSYRMHSISYCLVIKEEYTSLQYTLQEDVQRNVCHMHSVLYVLGRCVEISAVMSTGKKVIGVCV